MLAIARGMMALPRVLLLDEPSLGLAPAIVNELFDVLAELRDEGVTILLVDQVAALALAIADRAYVLESGQIVRADSHPLWSAIRRWKPRIWDEPRRHSKPMPLDLVLRRALIAGRYAAPMDIGIGGGRIVAIEPYLAADAEEENLGGRLVIPGFVETHIHLDKSCILERCRSDEGTLEEAIAEVAAAKRTFTEDDVYARGRRTLEKAIVQGTTHMRTHVEVDPRVRLRSFDAIRRLKHDYQVGPSTSRFASLPQEGLINDPGTEELLVEACRRGADLIGGCPYTDSDPNGHMARVFTIASRFDLDIDFHLDFDLDASWMHLHEVCRLTKQHGWGGRVAVGHVTKLSAIDLRSFDGHRAPAHGRRCRGDRLPATDLFLMGAGHEHSIPRGVAPAHRLREQGVTCSLATNNVLNPFTPLGDCSLIRMANSLRQYCAAAACAGTRGLSGHGDHAGREA